MRKFANGAKVTDKATLSYIDTLYAQMTALEKAIAKYSLLESTLLGAANAYGQLEAAKSVDEEADYGSKAEELVTTLVNALTTGELGTQAAQVAFEGLIPEEVIAEAKANAEDLDGIMQYIYDNYIANKDKPLLKLFEFEFDDDGNLTSAEMTREKVQAFTDELLNAKKVFTGEQDEATGHWDYVGFTDEFSQKLKDARDPLQLFADELNVTKEVAFAYLTELEKFDISWLGGDYNTLLDQLMSGNLEYAIDKNLQALADLEYKAAHGQITKAEYDKKWAELNADYLKNQDQARSNVQEWTTAQSKIESAQKTVDEMSDTLTKLKASGASEQEISIAEGNLQKAVGELYEAQTLLNGLEEPTEIVLQFASKKVEEQIANANEFLSTQHLTLEAILEWDEEKGTYKVKDGYEDKFAQDTLDGWISLMNEQSAINKLLDTGVTSTNEYLSGIATTVTGIYSLLGGQPKESTDKNDSGGGENASEEDEFTFEDVSGEEIFIKEPEKSDEVSTQQTIETPAELIPGTSEFWAEAARIAQEEAKKNYNGSEAGAGNAGIYGPAYEDPSTLSGGKQDVSDKEDEFTFEDISGEPIFKAEKASIASESPVATEDEFAFAEISGEPIFKAEKVSVTSESPLETEDDLTFEDVSGEKILTKELDAKPSHSLPEEDLLFEEISGEPIIQAEKVTVASAAPLEEDEFTFEDVSGEKIFIKEPDAEHSNGAFVEEEDLRFEEVSGEPIIKIGNATIETDTLQDDTGFSFSDPIDMSALGEPKEAKTLSEASQEISEAAQQYLTSLQQLNALMSAGFTESDYLNSGEAAKFGIEIDEDGLISAIEAYKRLEEQLQKIEVPTTNMANFAVEQIDQQMQALQDALDSNDFTKIDPISLGLEVDANPTEIKTAIETKLATLQLNKDLLSFFINLAVSEEDQFTVTQILDRFNQWQMNSKVVPVYASGVDATKKGLKEIDNLAAKDATKTVTVVTQQKNGGTQQSSGGSIWSNILGWLGGKNAVNGTAHAQGTAYKGGSWGAPKTETALTGELGPELRVRGNRWELLGEHGAEFNEVKKGDIKK